MKKLMIVGLAIGLIWFGSAAAQEIAADYAEAVEVEKEKPITWCPTTLISDNNMCFVCHVVSGGKFVLKATPPDAHIDYPLDAKIINYGTKQQVGYYFLNAISPGSVQKMLWFFNEYGLGHIVIEIHCYGGGLFDAWRIKGLFDEWKAGGGIIETRVYGGAMSAGFMVFCAGSKGHRFVSETAEFMWHEAQIGQWFELTSASKEEEKARIYRHLEDNGNAWLATRGKMSKKEIDEKIAFKEFWFTGREAVELGFADGFIK